MTSRRSFLGRALQCAPAGLLGTPLAALADPLAPLLRQAPKARHWRAAGEAGANCVACHQATPRAQRSPHPAGLVQCQLCAHRCGIAAGQRGRCRARYNVGGELRSLTYGHPLALGVDPIEKKPFYHFLPGSAAFSFGSAGCPLACRFCQNWELSQSSPEDHPGAFVTPEQMVEACVARGAPVVAFTYNEPTVFFEYLMDVARAGARRQLRSVLVSCGFMNEAPLAEMCATLAAIKIDLKGFSEDFYRNVSRAELRPVLRSIKQIAASRVHLEIVNLVVPTQNDSEPLLKALAEWVVGELGPDVPVHYTRFHPDYQLLNLSPTPIATLERAREIALSKGLRYAYVGNVPGHAGNHTYCPKCGQVVIRRSGFFVVENNLAQGACRSCRHPIAGVWA